MNQHDSYQPPPLQDKWNSTRDLFERLGLLQDHTESDIDDAAYRAILKGEAK